MKIYIAEDEPLATAKLKLFLEKLEEGDDITTFDNGISALAAINEREPDLLFLDIQMPGLTGMEILSKISGIPTIITSAYDQYAIDSFSLNVTDYLLKPYTLDRLKTSIAKARREIRMNEIERNSQAHKLTIRIDGLDETILEENILYLESEKDYVRIITDDRQRKLTKGSMNSFEEQLDKETFARVHRSFIVNQTKVKNWGRLSLIMIDGTEIPIGRTYKTTIK